MKTRRLWLFLSLIVAIAPDISELVQNIGAKHGASYR